MKTFGVLVLSVLLGCLIVEKCEAAFPIVLNTWPFVNATARAWRVLEETDDPLQAVEHGCSQCESDRCDGTVGYGGSPDEFGESTLDAMIMDGSTHNAGSVAGLKRVKNGISVARAIMNYTKHTLLVGDSATQFAIEMGFKQEDLHSVESMKRWIEWYQSNCQPNFRTNVSPDPTTSCGPYKPVYSKSEQQEKQKQKKNSLFSEKSHDTIGMIAINSAGSIAVGTSSNGATHKVPGRVGDAPIIGSGGYVDNEVGAACATGDGDIMMRFVPSYQAVESMRNGMKPTDAAKDALQRIIKKFPNFSGAMVVADKFGNHGGACHGFSSFAYSYQDNSAGTKLMNVDCS